MQYFQAQGRYFYLDGCIMGGTKVLSELSLNKHLIEAITNRMHIYS